MSSVHWINKRANEKVHLFGIPLLQPSNNSFHSFDITKNTFWLLPIISMLSSFFFICYFLFLFCFVFIIIFVFFCTCIRKKKTLFNLYCWNGKKKNTFFQFQILIVFGYLCEEKNSFFVYRTKKKSKYCNKLYSFFIWFLLLNCTDIIEYTGEQFVTTETSPKDWLFCQILKLFNFDRRIVWTYIYQQCHWLITVKLLPYNILIFYYQCW